MSNRENTNTSSKRRFWRKVFFIALPFLLIGGCQIAILCSLTGDLSPLLPFTMPTKVRFIDGETKKPVTQLPVYFLWGWSASNAGGSSGTGISHTFRGMTDGRGEVRLPMHWKPIPILMYPLCGRTFDGIHVFHGNPRYWLGPKEMSSGRWTGGRTWLFFGSELIYEIEMPRETLAGWGENLTGPANLFGRAVWKQGLSGLIGSAGSFQKLPGEALVGIEKSCWYHADMPCEENDKEILRRDPSGETPPGRRSLYRQGLWKQAIRAIEKWDTNQNVVRELKLTASCSDAAFQLAKKKSLLGGEQQDGIVRKLVQQAKKARIEGDKNKAVISWLSIEPFLTNDEMAEASQAAQELGLWRLSERFARHILLMEKNSADAWELRSKALANISLTEGVTPDPTLSSAAEQAAMRAVRIGGKASAWLALAEARKRPFYNSSAREAVWAAVKVAPNDPKVKQMLSEAGPMPPWFRLPKIELPDIE